MSVDAVRTYLTQFGREQDVRVFSVSSATVELAARALGVAPERIAKTVGLYGGEPDSCILVVAAGDAKINGGAFKRAFGLKPRMLAATDVEPLTGSPIGGVCPFGVPDTARVLLDESLRRFDTVFPACGSANSAIELTLADLEKFSAAEGWVDVCANWRDEPTPAV